MADIHGTKALRRDGRFTLADWRSWPADERWELIGGEAYDMSPAPRVNHQERAGDLYHDLRLFLKAKPCKPYISPIDVFLDEDNGIHGAPDFVAEILSEGTAYKDLGAKKDLYARHGVREYWVVHPGSGSVTVFRHDGKGFAPGVEFPAGTAVTSAALPGFSWLCSV
jgi:Uma2 family endonuclease